METLGRTNSRAHRPRSLIGEIAAAHRPDMVITDVRMPPTHTDEGMVAALKLARLYPSMSIVVLSQHVQRRYAAELLAHQRKGIGYLLKQRISDVDTFRADLRRIYSGSTVTGPEVIALMVRQSGTGQRSPGSTRGSWRS